MLPVASIEHQLPGRLRLRIPSKRGDRGFFEAARERLDGKAAITEVSANFQTGSLLILHSGDARDVAREASQNGLFTLQRSEASAAASKRAGSKGGAHAAPPSAAAAALSGLGLYQISQGRVLGSASEAFWNAYAAQTVVRSTPLALALFGIGLFQLLKGQWLGPASALLFYAAVLQGRGVEMAPPPADSTDK